MVMGMETTDKHLTKSEVRASASRANGAKGGRPSNSAEFMRGFAKSAALSQEQAAEQWAGYSRQLSDKARETLERGGYELGKREGAGFKQMFG